MEQILSKLSEIETVTKSIMDDAARQKQVLSDEMEQRLKAFDEQLDKETEQRIREIRAGLEKEKDAQLAALRSNTEQALAQLDAYYEQNHTQLAQKIYQEIITLS